MNVDNANGMKRKKKCIQNAAKKVAEAAKELKKAKKVD